MKLLITGGCGFLGSNLASHAIKLGMEVIVFDNLSRYGSSENLQWLRSIGDFTHVHGDIRNKNDVTRLIQKFKPDNVFHLAGQVAMTTSIDNPQMDFEVNVGGTFNLLEATRLFNPECGIIYSSTNKVYGDLEQFTYRENKTRYECIEKPNGFDESVQLTFHSPYGCSKGAADQYMLDYARIYGLKTAVFRHSSMYGGRQFATYDQGWVGWFCQKAVEANRGIKAPFTISGNGKQVRDVLHAEDIISLYFSTLAKLDLARGNAFNIGGTIQHSLSLLELFSLLEKYSGVELNYTQLPVRESDQKVFVADINKINKFTDWSPKVDASEGVRKMYDWCNNY
ncbi:CDP-paratose 2-epimerase [Yersinia entomophaga]|uniref:CDP-paratose 2-epimerase n=1 Tax=Yersinia entomophaga TaxID=935293 RepID=A0ABM6BG54_YERET|nr:GDP-mannose 4,6-dehydratase [Yersinia entomophaga]ANI28362.1 CDP-paratose 2-epimerase [Yersinia entomophaga]OWF88170.1 CDP-paratose 2-epimerase [Yersinia entomophaga]